MLKTSVRAGLGILGVATSLIAASPGAAAIPVFDVTNYAQNALQAAHALEQINHQVQALQNQAAMLQNMARNLERFDFPEIGQMSSALQQIDKLMGAAQAIGFKADRLDEQFRGLFPNASDPARTDQRLAEARARLQSAMDGFRRTMTVQANVVGNIEDDGKLLSALAARSQSAQGALQAQQATNQLLALGAKQQLQLESLIAAEFRSEALESARRVQAQEEGEAATARFLGSGTVNPSPRN